MQDLPTIAAGVPAGQRSAPERSGQFTHTHSREEVRAFLQQRVASFGLMFACLFGIFLCWRTFSVVVQGDRSSIAFLPWQVASVAVFASMWLLCRGGARPYIFIRALEFIALNVAAALATLMCLQISYAWRPDATLLLCLSYTLIARSIMIPSTATRTFVYGIWFMIPFLLAVFFIHLQHHDAQIYTALADPRLRGDAEGIARRWTIMAGLWWTFALIISTATSKVIYGLRHELRDARRLGQYTLTEKLGQGGMGIVYRASHAMLRRPSAIKLLPPERYGTEALARFEREVQLTAKLSHPNTIRVFDYGRTPDGVFYYVMEYLEGASLDEIVGASGPMPAGRVIHLLDQVAGALGEAHGIGLIHRDIKPANIFLTQQGGVLDVAKVLDFGLVKQVDQNEVPVQEQSTLPALTHEDRFTGTPQYMSPEAITTPEAIDARADLYSLGAVGYFLLTGQHVFTGRSLVEVCSHHLHSVPPPPSLRLGRAIPEDLEALILACLAKTAEKRPENARALQSALRACRDAESWSEDDARRWLDTYGASLRARHASGAVQGTATIAVDLGLRAADDTHRRRAG